MEPTSSNCRLGASMTISKLARLKLPPTAAKKKKKSQMSRYEDESDTTETYSSSPEGSDNIPKASRHGPSKKRRIVVKKAKRSGRKKLDRDIEVGTTRKYLELIYCQLCQRNFQSNYELNDHLLEVHDFGDADVDSCQFRTWRTFHEWLTSKGRTVNHRLVTVDKDLLDDGSIAYKRLVCSYGVTKDGRRRGRSLPTTCSCFVIARRSGTEPRLINAQFCFNHYGHKVGKASAEESLAFISPDLKLRVVDLIKEGLDKTTILRRLRDECASNPDETEVASLTFKNITTIARSNHLKTPKNCVSMQFKTVEPYNPEQAKRKEASPIPGFGGRRSPGPGRLTKFKTVRSYFSNEVEDKVKVAPNSMAAREFRPEQEILEENLSEITRIVTEISDKVTLIGDSETAARILDQLRETDWAIAEILAEKDRPEEDHLVTMV